MGIIWHGCGGLVNLLWQDIIPLGQWSRSAVALEVADSPLFVLFMNHDYVHSKELN